MLVGSFSHTVDSKNRVFVPAKFREDLGVEFVIFRSPSGNHLIMLSTAEWDNYVAPFKELEREKAERIFRFLTRNAAQVSPDSQGRIVLPQSLLSYASIEKTAMIVGCDSYAEIWSEEVYNAYVDEEDTDDIRASLTGVKFR